ncbi:phage tail tube protein [Burkholderia sp. USMB20]|uniref:phage tail tube protein n=1 Tax=Burkholderia sp. USMB20 TaxID=1571773 RepID=UPI0005CDE827|nr:phage tail tube protein [Burkholderia sp. USMB20]TGN96123.1 hypothetical protein PL79_018950 [Burkholderia sp. USMB20]
MAGKNVAVNAQHSQVFVDTSDQADGGAPVWTQVKGMKSLSGFDGSAADIDTTDMDSTAKEKMPGLMDNGTFTIEVNRNLTDPGQAALLAMQKSQEIRAFKLVYPDKTADGFDAYVSTFPINGGVDAVMTAQIKLTITGDVVPLDSAGNPAP